MNNSDSYRLPTKTFDLTRKVTGELTKMMPSSSIEALTDAILSGESSVTVPVYPPKRYIPNPAMRAAIARLPTL